MPAPGWRIGEDGSRTALLRRGFLHGHHTLHHAGEALPVAGVGSQLAAAGAGDRVELGLAVVIGGAPVRFDPSALLETNERRVDRALVEQDFVAADLLNTAGDAVT